MSITATVRPVVASTTVPTGSVDFSVDGSWYWTSTLDANGSYSYVFLLLVDKITFVKFDFFFL